MIPSPSTPSISPLRQRMLEDMRMRKLEPRTQEAYIRAVRKLADYLKRSPQAATEEDLRNFQLHLVDTGSSPMTLNATLTGLKFFFDITLGRIELMAKMQPVKLPRTLPVVLSCEEVSRLLAAAHNIKHQVALSVAYGAGLRASEVVSLRVTDVDSQRMTLRVEQGKGAKDRYAMLSPVLLRRLRTWWHLVAPGPCPGQDAAWRLAVPRHDALGASFDSPAQPRRSCGSRCRWYQQAGHYPHPAPQLCHASAGAQGRYPRDPGAAGAQEAGDHIDLRPRGD